MQKCRVAEGICHNQRTCLGGSKNGTQLNGAPIPPEGRWLSNGDRVELAQGQVVLRFHSGTSTITLVDHASADAAVRVDAASREVYLGGVRVEPPAAISRFGWLFPQLFVAFVAQRRTHRLPLYMTGAFGRVACLAAIGALMWLGGSSPSMIVVVLFFVLWAVYALVSGIVAVPYNDIVARSIPSTHRSRLLATRFFVGGILALAVAAVVHRLLAAAPSQGGFGAVLVLGAALFMISALFFVSAGEPKAPLPAQALTGFVPFLRGGLIVFARDSRFRTFLVSRWLGGTVTMALPFYILQVNSGGGAARYVAVLLGAQTVGALLSNPLWGWCRE